MAGPASVGENCARNGGSQEFLNRFASASAPRQEAGIGADCGPAIFNTTTTMNTKDLIRIGLSIGGVLAIATRSATGARGETRIWTSADGKRTAQIPGVTPLYALAFSHDGKTLATAGADGRIRLYDSATGKAAGDFIPVPIAEKWRRRRSVRPALSRRRSRGRLGSRRGFSCRRAPRRSSRRSRQARPSARDGPDASAPARSRRRE